MSALKLLREVMSEPHDPVQYDTDTVSTTSTVENEDAEVWYNTECIIAENDNEDECYLVKWEDYPLDQCTWEPPENLDGTDLITTWKQVKKELGEAAFRRENEKNITAYHEAKKAAEVAKARKYNKREKKRKTLQRRDRRVVFDDDSSEEEPLMTAGKSGGLFVDEQRRTTPGSPVKSTANARQRPAPRKAPLQQSSSDEESSSEVQDSDGSLLGEMRKKKKAMGKAERREARKALASSILQKNNQLKDAVPATPPGRPEIGPQWGKDSAATTKTISSNASGQDRTVVTSTTTQKTTESAVFKTGSKAIRTAPPKQTNPGINFVDEPQGKRKERNTDSHYNKLKFRRLAEKRARTEATPDFGALNFVNGPPPSLPKANRKPTSDLYARREITNRRVQEEDPDDRPRVGQDAQPLASWEKDKVPMMCNAWYLSSNCVYGAEKCFFMHREHDPEGRPYLLGDMHNRVHHKYRKPPITCDYWYNGNRCKKPAEDCPYAHEDTGWTEINGQPIQRKHVSSTNAGPTSRDVLPQLVPFKLQNPPITCHFWLRDSHGCNRSEADCKYAHWNTGWAPPEHKITDPPVQIDPDLRPRGVAPKYANPPITCPYWFTLDHGCSRTDDEFMFAHFNTGWIRTGMGQGQTVRLDPQRLPRSQSQPNIDNDRLKGDISIPPGPRSLENAPVPLGPRPQDTKRLTCPAWLRDPRGCPKSEDACHYSHRNTGWATPKDRPSDAPVALDPNQITRAHRDALGDRLEPKYRNPPITCPSWLRNAHGCHKTDSECDFAHSNTGWTLGTGNGSGRPPPVQIDRNEEPRTGPARLRVDLAAPKNRNPPITCFFWLEGLGGCMFNAATCKFAHRNTGWMIHYAPGKNANPERIDPTKRPRFRKFDPTEDDSAQNSHIPSALRKGSLSLMSEPGFEIPDRSLDAAAPNLAQNTTAIQDAQPVHVPTATNASQIDAKIEKFYNVNICEMFHSIVPGDDQPLERRAMLLYSPEDHPEDVDLITRWLLMHGVQVSNLWYDGAWTQFHDDLSEGKSGIIIAHPDFERWVELPGLGDVLKQRVRVWSVGLQPPSEYEFGVSPHPPELRYDRVDIFPHGGFIYITDDVFDQKPHLALSIVKQFFARIEKLRSLDGPASPWLEVDDACLLWRLCVRPELMESLFQKCEENSGELAAQNPDYLSRAELYQLLTSTNYIEQDHPIEPLSSVQDRYPILSERRVIAEHPPLNYFNRVANSQGDANTHMISYYAAMQSADLDRTYRHFYVVHTEPEADCAKAWKASIHNITGIITPELCFEELSKESKESMFDFLDWAMKPKENPPAVEPEQEEMGDAPMEKSSPTKEGSTGLVAY